MTSTRPREGRGVRHTAGGEHDRLRRAVLQPVQCWDKKWAESKNGKQLKVFKWVKSDRQVDFDDGDEDEEIEQIPVHQLVEDEAGTPAPALPTLQDADDTTASTPAQIGDDDDEDDSMGTSSKDATKSTSAAFEGIDKKPLTALVGSAPLVKSREHVPAPHDERDAEEDDDTDSSRPLVFTPSLETPVETQANTPQDFESPSPVPVENDELKREAQVELVVKGLDEGQAEMEDEMEEEVVEKEKEHPHVSLDGGDKNAEGHRQEESAPMEIERAEQKTTHTSPTALQSEGASEMEIDLPTNRDQQ